MSVAWMKKMRLYRRSRSEVLKKTVEGKTQLSVEGGEEMARLF